MRRLFALVVTVFLVGCHSHPRAPRPATRVSHNGPEVNFIAMGDWGSNDKRQKQVAETMADYVQSTGKQFDAVLLCGDNFYQRLLGTDDAKWQTMFEQMYDPQRL